MMPMVAAMMALVIRGVGRSKACAVQRCHHRKYGAGGDDRLHDDPVVSGIVNVRDHAECLLSARA